MKDKIERYKKLINECPGIELKGKNMLYTSANGHMFSQLNKQGELGIRFSEEIKKVYLEEFNTLEFKSYGAVMKGYILITEHLWQDMEKIKMLMNESQAYVQSLDPK